MFDVHAAERLASEIMYKPEWSIYPGEIDGDTLCVFVDIYTRNSDREEARRGYPTWFTITTSITVDVSNMDRDGFLAAIIAAIVQIEAHEAREFFRVRSDDYAAPYHPHRPEGIAAWEAVHESVDISTI